MSDVINLDVMASQKAAMDRQIAEQARGEAVQKKILAANLATQVVDGADLLDPGKVWTDVATAIESFLTVE